jgi:very-short-patch-repair endonuclease
VKNLPIVLDDGHKLSNCWVTRQLRGRGWKVIRIWQHSLKKSPASCLTRIRRAIPIVMM